MVLLLCLYFLCSGVSSFYKFKSCLKFIFTLQASFKILVVLIFIWNSIDSLQRETSNPASKFNLPNTRRRKVSSLEEYKPKNITKMRRQKKCIKFEEDTLRTGVALVLTKCHYKFLLSILFIQSFFLHIWSVPRLLTIRSLTIL